MADREEILENLLQAKIAEWRFEVSHRKKAEDEVEQLRAQVS